MLAIQLFISFAIISIIYLLLLQYTKFFTYLPYLVKVSLNLNFYFTIVYIICFLLSLVFIAIDWYDNIMYKLLETVTDQTSNGVFLRHVIFTQLLYSHINFSTVIKPPESVFRSMTYWAGWWESVFRAKIQACVSDPLYVNIFVRKIVDTLDTIKEKPNRILASFQKAVTDENLQPFVINPSSRVSLLPASFGQQKVEARKVGRPKGSLDKQKFSNRGRPKKN